MHASTCPATTNWKGVASTCLIVIAWLYLNIRTLQWLLQSLGEASSFNLILIGLVLIALLVQVVRYRQQLEFSPTLRIRPYPLLLMLGSAVSAIALQRFVDILQLSAILFALGTYGLCGLLLSPTVWRKGLPPAALVACILPFSVQAGTGLGFPVRVLTARIVEQLLSAWHVAAISSYDIIVLENGIAHVDLPCSGLRSLWTGTLFLLATTWLEGRQIGIRWFLICGINLLLQVVANIVRVTILVVIMHLQQPAFAQMLHLPLGLLGFICACAISWAMLQTVPKHSSPTLAAAPAVPASIFPTYLLLFFLITLALIPQVPQSQAKPLFIASLNLPPTIVRQVPLTTAEQNLFNNSASAIAQKQRFVFNSVTGSMLFVSSTSWNAYHPPELCFVGNGLKVDRMDRTWLTSEIQGRWLSLQDGKLSATYWFQSPVQTTDDFFSRFWSQVTRRQKIWTMVSVLFDRYYSPDNPEVRAFATTIHDVIQNSLTGGGQ